MGEKRSIEEINEYLANRNATYRAIQESHRDGYLDCLCNVCGQKFERKRKKLLQDCPICKNKKLVVGYNDMATTAKWMIPYLKDKEDAHRYMKSASKRIMFRCPDCGYEKEAKINNVFNFGFSCPICGDGISRPNKFVRALFLQVKVDNLQFEYSSEWTDGKRFDLYFELNNQKYVVEMDGEQHFKNSSWGKYNAQRLNDGYKNLLSWKNNIKIIRIPCICRGYKKMKEDFLNSEIGFLFNDVDWMKCIETAERSCIIEICKYFNEHNESAVEIGKKFGLSKPTIRHYLTIGTYLGFCNYDIKEEKAKGIEKSIQVKKKNSDKKRELNLLKVCDYANKHKKKSIEEIHEKLNIPSRNVSLFIREGNRRGICQYSLSDNQKRNLKKAAQKAAFLHGRKTKVYDGETLVGYFLNMTECVDKLNEIYPEKKISRETIRKQLVKKPSCYYKGLLFFNA